MLLKNLTTSYPCMLDDLDVHFAFAISQDLVGLSMPSTIPSPHLTFHSPGKISTQIGLLLIAPEFQDKFELRNIPRTPRPTVFWDTAIRSLKNRRLLTRPIIHMSS